MLIYSYNSNPNIFRLSLVCSDVPPEYLNWNVSLLWWPSDPHEPLLHSVFPDRWPSTSAERLLVLSAGWRSVLTAARPAHLQGGGCGRSPLFQVSAPYLHNVSSPEFSLKTQIKQGCPLIVVEVACGGGRWAGVVVWLMREEDDWWYLCSLLIFNVRVGFYCPRASRLNFRSNSRRTLEHVCPSSEEIHLNQKQWTSHLINFTCLLWSWSEILLLLSLLCL